ncbi:alpha/beta hydrolase [Salmonella enterica]|uniref:alpha/beta hydrolase n=1 Tax=Salmonella enterica TaxID=28901 RepID=UPI00398C7079
MEHTRVAWCAWWFRDDDAGRQAYLKSQGDKAVQCMGPAVREVLSDRQRERYMQGK